MENKILDLTGLAHYNEKVNGELDKKQDALVSGTNIKTINGQPILGEGDITIVTSVETITDTEIGDLFGAGVLETNYVPQEAIQEAINAEY